MEVAKTALDGPGRARLTASSNAFALLLWIAIAQAVVGMVPLLWMRLLRPNQLVYTRVHCSGAVSLGINCA